MPLLEESEYAVAEPLLRNLSAFHLAARELVTGLGGGTIWVDNPGKPMVVFAQSFEGSYLAGDPGCRAAYPALSEVIPQFAYLIFDPPGWEAVLDQVWPANPAARRHEREHYVFRQESAPALQSIPAGYQVMAVDERFFERTHLKNFEAIEDWVSGWRSREDFLARGAGMVVVHGDTIASFSLMDCGVGDCCEIGIITDPAYRRRGLGKLAVSAMIDACLKRGYREIGWQCLKSNIGSRATALSTGFQKERDYLAFSSFLPAESAGDLSQEEYADWARHYERFAPRMTWSAFGAVMAWSMAGQVERAVENLRFLAQAGWKMRVEHIQGNWRLKALSGNSEAQALLAEISLKG